MLFSTERLTVIQEANTKTATAIFTTSPTHNSDSEEILERPTKRPRITHEMKVQHLATRTDASRQAVLQTNELLGGILSFLTPKQLFVDQRVCKQWRDVIAGCPELQRNMFLRVDEVPRQTWGFKAKYSYPDQRILSELRRFDNSPLSQPWRQLTPVVFSPHMTITNDDDGDGDEKEDGSGTSDRDYIAFELPCSLQIRSHSSILDTYFCNPPCYVFEFYLEFKFEPEIPGYRHLSVGGVRVQGGQALRVGEALDRAMAVRTDAVLVRKHRDETITTKKWRYVTGDQITKELQNEYKCVATICKSSMLMLNSVFVPNEQQQAEVDAAYARMKQGSE